MTTQSSDESTVQPVAEYIDVPYGPHERHTVNFWQAKGDGPRPLLVYIHGGGWTNGSKPPAPDGFVQYLERGISIAAINYRYSTEVPLPAPVHDAARALQFIRSKAKEWNFDKEKVALIGGSAGACTSLWLAFHKDLADPTSPDPVARESTRAAAVVAISAQTSIDPKVVAEWLGPNVLEHRMLWLSVGEPDAESLLRNYDKHRETLREFSPYNHYTADAPPVLMVYNRPMTLPCTNGDHGIHHPVYGMKLKEKADQLGKEFHIIVENEPRFSAYDSNEEFLFAKLLR